MHVLHDKNATRTQFDGERTKIIPTSGKAEKKNDVYLV